MIEETVAKIEQAIRRAGDADPKHKEELIRLLGQLKAEVRGLPAAQGEKARSIAHYAEAAAHEAARKEKSAKLLEMSRGALQESVVGFEASHPRLTAVVNDISALLARIGI
ncbi:MAG: hypothetical protein A2X40_02555 [Elusimicrobia bacterium GWC2_65_9]|nr:MAG: hypothetical protein A2X37_00270 [Elusimicrobia bacterium GWA2_66_18]OGR73836.1 MAG: hypothetical protein A2X40_02555 [Elusimicrobia bacterium GWC2_65_9]